MERTGRPGSQTAKLRETRLSRIKEPQWEAEQLLLTQPRRSRAGDPNGHFNEGQAQGSLMDISSAHCQEASEPGPSFSPTLDS